jgi:hypothetical protein
MNRCAIYNEVAARIQGNNKVSERIKLQLWGADIAIAHARNVEGHVIAALQFIS